MTTFADTVSRYLEDLTKLADSQRRDIEEKNRLVRDHAFEIASDPTKTYVPPKAEEAPPFLNFAPLQNAVARVQKSAREFDRVVAAHPGDAALDHAIMHLEQALTRTEGLPRRPWFRHQIYAPGFYTGYGVKTVPGVREAIEQKSWGEANEQIAIAAKVLEGYAAEVDRAAQLAR